MSENNPHNSEREPVPAAPEYSVGEATDHAAEVDLATIPELAPLAIAVPSEAPPNTLSRGSTFDGPPSNGHVAADPPLPPARDPNAPLNDKEQDLFEHLAELRIRLLRCVAYVAVAMTGAWFYGNTISEWFARPIRAALDRYAPGSKMITLDPTEGFMIYFQIVLAAALLLVMPLILCELWGFVEPALTNRERKHTLVLVPFSITLFFVGSVFGYFLSPVFFQFFLQFQPPETLANFSYGRSIVLLAKMLLIFGVCFQVPVITIFLNKIGLISRNWMIDYWRHVVVAIVTIVAIITPTWDPITLVACAAPPCLLYGVSIWLVKWL
ncbi:MAG TPA: twin-arginine translocase subunit TatC [Abditibacteriaceae bacterium]|nr:twin-arginine translocase subunit TatC [Abditibacteriaceae bacterium]